MGRSVDICPLVYFINQIKRLVVGKKMGEDKMRGEEGSMFLWSPVRRSKGKGQTGDTFPYKIIKVERLQSFGEKGTKSSFICSDFLFDT